MGWDCCCANDAAASRHTAAAAKREVLKYRFIIAANFTVVVKVSFSRMISLAVSFAGLPAFRLFQEIHRNNLFRDLLAQGSDGLVVRMVGVCIEGRPVSVNGHQAGME